MPRSALASLIITLLICGCASVKVSTDYDSTIDFGAYRTYAWMAAAEQKTGDARLDSPLLVGRIRAAVERELGAKSFRRVKAGQPDFLVGHHLSLEKRLDVQTIDRYYGYGARWHAGGISETRITEYEEGTLILDIVDLRRNRLTWRGVGSRRIPRTTTPEESTRNVNEAVAAILASFPPEQREEQVLP